MSEKQMLVFDCETNGLLHDVSEIHCIAIYDTQKEGIERARGLTDDQINTVKGSISLHGGANEPVKGGKS